MKEKTITLTIEKLAGLGDGAAQFEGRKIFVPYATQGDVLRVDIVRETKDARYGAIREVITPGPGRVAPACKHFGSCGGCALQHVNDADYAEFKWQMAREAVRKAGFDPACVMPLARVPVASRRRVELKVEGGRLGYYEEGSHRLVDIEECKVLGPELEALVMRLKKRLADLPGLSRIQINGVDGGFDLLLEGADTLLWPINNEPGISRVSLKAGDGCRTLYEARPVTLTLGGVKVPVPPGAFLQASKEAQEIMTRFVQGAVGQAGKVLDLFAGIGSYSFPLSARAEVTAVEGDAAMVKAMQSAAPAGRRFKAEQRDLFKSPLPPEVLNGFDTVVMNPPRAGAKEQSAMLARSKVKKLVMISCNPATFSRDARLMKEGGFRLENLVPLDQFIYSPHLEINAKFVK